MATSAGLASGLVVKTAMEIGDEINKSIKNRKNNDNDSDSDSNVPSPDERFSANSPFEENSPLEVILEKLFTMEILDLVFLILLVFVQVDRRFSKYILEFLLKYIPEKYISWFTLFKNKSIKYNNIFTMITSIYFIIILFIIKFFVIYVFIELNNNIDDYVEVYNQIKSINKSTILLIMNYNNYPNNINIIQKYTLYSISLFKFKNLNVINYLRYKLLSLKKRVHRVVKMLYTWGLLAWVFIKTHQRLNVKHSSTPYRRHINNIKFTRQNLYCNKKNFYLWLQGFTDAAGTFQIEKKNDNWVLIFKLSLQAYNIRLLYFIKKRLGAGTVKKEGLNCSYTIRDRKKLNDIIFPIFDNYKLLTDKYFYYENFRGAYDLLEKPDLTKDQKDKIILDLVKEEYFEGRKHPI